MNRHGRKNREKLRAWKQKHDPERFAQIKAEIEARRDPDIGRLRLFSRYADRELVVMTGGDQHDPVLERMHHDDIVLRNKEHHGNWISNRMVKRFGRYPDLDDRCWYCGVQLYVIPYDLFEQLGRQAPWKASREHLVPERNGGAGQGEGNITVAGRYLNARVGHNPLPVKVATRQHLQQAAIDRDTPTWATYLQVKRFKIEVENMLRLGNGYPWQNWCYEPGTRERRMADDFAAQMTAAEEEFLALDAEGRAQWIEGFRWRW